MLVVAGNMPQQTSARDVALAGSRIGGENGIAACCLVTTGRRLAPARLSARQHFACSSQDLTSCHDSRVPDIVKEMPPAAIAISRIHGQNRLEVQSVNVALDRFGGRFEGQSAGDAAPAITDVASVFGA